MTEEAFTKLFQELAHVDKVQTMCYRLAGNIRESLQTTTVHLTDAERVKVVEWQEWFTDLAVSLNKFIQVARQFPAPENQSSAAVNVTKVVDKASN